MYLRKVIFLTSIVLINHIAAIGNESIGVLESRIKNTRVDTVKIELLLQMGDYFENTNYDSALHFYLQALELSRNPGNISNKKHKEKLQLLEIKSLRYIIHLNNAWGKYQEGIDNSMKVLEMLSELKQYSQKIRIKLSIGSNYYYLGDLTAAAEHFVKALEIAEEHNIQDNIASLNTNLATIHYVRGNYLKSLDYYQTALGYFREFENFRDEGLAYLGIGNIYNSMGNFSKAKENYLTALDLLDELEDHSSIASINLSLGALYYQHNDSNNADKHYQKALYHAVTANDMRIQGQALLNMGILYSKEGNSPKALEHYEKALAISQQAGHKHTEASVLRNKAISLMRLRNFNQAIELAQKSLQLAREVESLEDQAQSLKVLSSISEGQERYRNALNYFQEYKQYSDSLLNIANQRQINEMDAYFQSEQKQQMIDLQSLQIEKNKIELKRKNQMVNTIFIVLAFVIILTIATLVHFNQKKITNMEIGKQKSIISDNVEMIKKQEDQLVEASRNIGQLENENILQLQQAAQTLQLAQIISEKHNKCPDELKQIFANKYFEVHLGEEQKLPDICTVRQWNDHALILIADTHLLPVDKKLLNIALGSFVDNHLKIDFIKKPNEYLIQLKEYFRTITSSFTTGEDAFNLNFAMLHLNKTDYKVRFTSEATILGLAIARNPGSIFRPMFDYQELQLIDPTSRIFDNPGITNSFSGIYEFKLKPSDRLYLINPEKQLSEGEETESHIKLHHEVVRFIDSHQNIEISLQGEYIDKDLKKQVGNNGKIRYLAVRGIEL
ncbi:MAG: tetratricopeptide repeat protein [Bacteroidetes bacterium]|nr:MAG: tetratricopeptide repeat protein [Bacteroidota bacterium]